MEKKKQRGETYHNEVFPLFTPVTLMLQHENRLYRILVDMRNFTAAFGEQLFPAYFTAACMNPLSNVFILQRQGRTDHPRCQLYKEINGRYSSSWPRRYGLSYQYVLNEES